MRLIEGTLQGLKRIIFIQSQFMTESQQNYSQILKNVQWENTDNYQFLNPQIQSWLTDFGSLSVRLSECCDTLTVQLLTNEMKNHKSSVGESYLLREVVLLGDEKPWVFGQTIIADSVLQSLDVDLSQQGETPLGFTIFNADNVKRDKMQVAKIELNGETLWARRSCLWMNNFPIQVAELFLPHSPLYQK